MVYVWGESISRSERACLRVFECDVYYRRKGEVNGKEREERREEIYSDCNEPDLHSTVFSSGYFRTTASSADNLSHLSVTQVACLIKSEGPQDPPFCLRVGGTYTSLLHLLQPLQDIHPGCVNCVVYGLLLVVNTGRVDCRL